MGPQRQVEHQQVPQLVRRRTQQRQWRGGLLQPQRGRLLQRLLLYRQPAIRLRVLRGRSMCRCLDRNKPVMGSSTNGVVNFLVYPSLSDEQAKQVI